MSIKNDYMEWQHDNEEQDEYFNRERVWLTDFYVSDEYSYLTCRLGNFVGTEKEYDKIINRVKEADKTFKINSVEKFDSFLDWCDVYRSENTAKMLQSMDSNKETKRINAEKKYLKL